jgi:hypothetical protein
MKRRVGLLVVGWMWWSGCSASAPPKPAEITLDPYEGLNVTLLWNAPVDLDLYFSDPSGETVYYGNAATHAGTRLRRDTSCREIAAGGTATEVAQSARLLPGRYRVGVDYIDNCGDNTRTNVPFRIVARLADGREQVDGQAQFEVFNQTVLEIEVGGEPLTMRRVEPSARPTRVLPAPRKKGLGA